MPRELPIFPLPIVLFPGAPQPLHIFEPRYRELLADCLAADRRFGIAYVPAEPAPGSESLPRAGDVGCVALIQNTQGLPDGRSNILTVGERRFVLVDWVGSDRPYRLARVEEFDDEPVEASEAATLAGGLRGGVPPPTPAPGGPTRPRGAVGWPGARPPPPSVPGAAAGAPRPAAD